MSVELRPFSPKERQLTKERLPPRIESLGCNLATVLFFAFLGMGLTIGVCVIAEGLWNSRPIKDWVEPPSTSWQSLLGYAVGLICGGVSLRRLWQDDGFERNDHLRDLEDGNVQVIHIEPEQVVEVDPDLNKGTGYVFAIDPNTVFYLGGQWLEDKMFDYDSSPEFFDHEHSEEEFEEIRVFPCTEFTVVRAPNSGVVLDLQFSGRKMSVNSKITDRDLVAKLHISDAHRYKDSHLLEGDFRELLTQSES